MKKVGAYLSTDNQCRFTVWAPEKKKMTLHLLSPKKVHHTMERDKQGYFSITLSDIVPGTRYMLQADEGDPFPDPASFSQPDGVHEASAVVDHNNYLWHDAHWTGMPLNELVIYELHTGTFTPEGSFEAIIPRLNELKASGITALELMPVAQFPGGRNWGYDGVFPYAVQNSYGGHDGLKKLVDACHQKGIAVILDVVYNHLGPEGNYLGKYAPYFTGKYSTPWGEAINFDGAWSDGVKAYFVENVRYWLEVFHIDGLRLDAIHTIFDQTAVNIWQLIEEQVDLLRQRTGRYHFLIAESDLNNPAVVQPAGCGGFGFDGQWLDDFHHALHVLLHPKDKERYEDFGRMQQLVKAYTDGFVHSGEYVFFRKRRHGASSAGVPGNRFVAFNQNHDQVGNRVLGERLSALVDFERQKLAAAALLLSPYIPLLFMGEEYAEEAPFFYFVSHSDPALITAVREGRKREFADFKGQGTPPDAQDEETFARSKLHWEQRYFGRHAVILRWYERLLSLRRTEPALQNFLKNDVHVQPIGEAALVLQRQTSGAGQYLLALLNFSEDRISYRMPSITRWEKILDASDKEWSAAGAAGIPTPGDAGSSGTVVDVPPCGVVVFRGEKDF